MATAETAKRPPITVERRREIFAKDYLTVSDIQDILGLDYSTAAKVVREIKHKMVLVLGVEPRIDLKGKVHVQDYLDVYRLPPERYFFAEVKGGITQNENGRAN